MKASVKGYLIAVLLVAVFLIVFNVPAPITRPIRIAAREILAPYQSALNGLWRGVTDAWSLMGQRKEIAAERERQAGEIALLKLELQKLDILRAENAELRRMLDLVRRTPVPRKLPAEVIAREDSGGWWQTIRLNQGSSDGVAIGMAVVAFEGLIGRTTNVTPHTCDVLLISDRNSRVSVRTAAGNVYGVMYGGGTSPLRKPLLDVLYAAARMPVEYLDKDAVIRAGDKLVTSGLSDIFPPDLPVGIITRVYPDPSGLYQHAELVPAADLGRLRRVFVILESRTAAAPVRKGGEG